MGRLSKLTQIEQSELAEILRKFVVLSDQKEKEGVVAEIWQTYDKADDKQLVPLLSEFMAKNKVGAGLLSEISKFNYRVAKVREAALQPSTAPVSTQAEPSKATEGKPAQAVPKESKPNVEKKPKTPKVVALVVYDSTTYAGGDPMLDRKLTHYLGIEYWAPTSEGFLVFDFMRKNQFTIDSLIKSLATVVGEGVVRRMFALYRRHTLGKDPSTLAPGMRGYILSVVGDVSAGLFTLLPTPLLTPWIKG